MNAHLSLQRRPVSHFPLRSEGSIGPKYAAAKSFELSGFGVVAYTEKALRLRSRLWNFFGCFLVRRSAPPYS